MRPRPFSRMVAACLLGIVSGFILFTLPGMLHWAHPLSLFAFVDAAVKDTSIVNALLLFALGGFLLGLALKWPYSLCAAICQGGSLPIIAVIEMLKDPTSHNLWPFEFMIYGVLSLISLLGMGAALALKRLSRTKASNF